MLCVSFYDYMLSQIFLSIVVDFALFRYGANHFVVVINILHCVLG